MIYDFNSVVFHFVLSPINNYVSGIGSGQHQNASLAHRALLGRHWGEPSGRNGLDAG